MDDDLEGMMRWILSETHAYNSVLSTLEDFNAWIGVRSTASVLLKAECAHVKSCTDPNFKVSANSVQRSIVEASEWSKKFLSDIWNKGVKEINIDESTKNRETVCTWIPSSYPCERFVRSNNQTFCMLDRQQKKLQALEKNWRAREPKVLFLFWLCYISLCSC